MRAISLWQPWASLMAIEAKRNETRPRAWSFTGEVAIHAAKLRWNNGPPDFALPALKWLLHYRHEFAAGSGGIEALYKGLPFGAIVCVVDKTGCVSTNDDNGDDRSLTRQELELGDYSANRFYYPTTNCRRLDEPVKVAGSQGIFILPPAIVAQIRKQIA